MTKLDWSRGGAELDPARVQRVEWFATPNKAKVRTPLPKAKKKKAAAVKADEKKQAGARIEKRADKLPARTAARALHRVAKRLRQGPQLEAAKLRKAAKREAADLQIKKLAAAKQARQVRLDRIALAEAAELARKQTPEYLAALRIEEELRAASERKRKDALRHEREPLRQLWRAKLLRQRSDS